MQKKMNDEGSLMAWKSKAILKYISIQKCIMGMTSRHYDGILDFWKKLQPKSLFECRNPPTVVVAKYNSALQYTEIR